MVHQTHSTVTVSPHRVFLHEGILHLIVLTLGTFTRDLSNVSFSYSLGDSLLQLILDYKVALTIFDQEAVKPGELI